MENSSENETSELSGIVFQEESPVGTNVPTRKFPSERVHIAEPLCVCVKGASVPENQGKKRKKRKFPIDIFEISPKEEMRPRTAAVDS